jgi:hypothetical protein
VETIIEPPLLLCQQIKAIAELARPTNWTVEGAKKVSLTLTNSQSKRKIIDHKSLQVP